MTGNYERAGIHDIDAFYADKFVHASHGQHYYESVLQRYDSFFARFRWFDRHIRPGTHVLDFGCGAGSLSYLTRKGCRMFGVELSAEGARQAKAAGYEDVFVGDVAEAQKGFDFFDYVVSEDVFGHIEFEHKDHLIEVLKRFLKPDGVMLHAIECGNIDYDGMSNDKLRAFVSVDGHVGMEPRSKILERFGRFFGHTEGEVRFLHCNTYLDLLKEVSCYGSGYSPELLDYLDQLGPSERLAFNVANGITFNSLEAYRTPTDDRGGGLLMLRASDAPLPDEDHEHLAFMLEPPCGPGTSIALDSPWMFAGWHPLEEPGSGRVRWTGQWASIRVPVTNDVGSVHVRFVVPKESLPSLVRLSLKNGGSVLADCKPDRKLLRADGSRTQLMHRSRG